MGDDNKVRSVNAKRGDESIQIHFIKLLYPLELSLTRAHHPGTIPSSDTDGDEGVDNSDASRESPYANSSPNLVLQFPKKKKISSENLTLQMIRIYITESSHCQLGKFKKDTLKVNVLNYK